MRCPDCGNSLMHSQTDRGNLHLCDQCFGMWFDRAGFHQYSLSLACEQKLSGNNTANLQSKALPGLGKMLDISRTCPQCNRQLKKTNFAYNSKIVIEKCVSCKGIWTNDIEMKKIVRHIQNDPDVEQICQRMQNCRAMNEIENIKEIIETIKKELGSWV